MTNRFGVDTDYCKNYLETLLRDMDNYTPKELSRALTRLALDLELIVSSDTFTVVGFPEWGTFEDVSEGLEDTSEITHLRCVDTDDDDESFTLGSVYEVVEDNCQVEDAHYVVRGDDNCTWCITKDTLEFAGDPDTGRFEIAYVSDSVQALNPTPKSEPEFGEIVHVNGSPYVFISIDEDGDYHLINGKGIEVFLELGDIDEYAPKDSTTQLRNLILKDIKEFCNNSLEDHMTSVVNFNIPELIDFIMMYKDNWET